MMENVILNEKLSRMCRKEGESSEEKRDIREWAFLFLGAAIGSGILLLPLQAGKVSLLTTFIAMVIGITGVYIGQSLMVRITSTTPNCLSYDASIEYHLGKKVGIILSVVYTIFIFTILVILGTGATTNFAAAIQYYGISHSNLQSHPMYVGVFLAFAILPVIFGERFLLSLIEKVVALKIVILVALIILFIPLWHSANIKRELSFSTVGLGHGVLELLPVIVFGVAFFTAIGSMVASLQRKYGKQGDEAIYKKGNMSNALALLLVGILMFIFISSTLFALTPASLGFAAQNNLTALAVIAKNSSGGFFSHFSILAGFVITVLAILTSFYAVVIGVVDSVISKLPKRIQGKKRSVTVGIFIILFLWIVLNINILACVIHVIAPLIVIFTFFLPVIAVYKSEKLKKYRNFVPILSILVGIIVLVASFM